MDGAMKRGSGMATRIRRGSEADIDQLVRISHAIWCHSVAKMLGIALDHWPMIAGIMHAELIPAARAILVAAQGPEIFGYSYRNAAMIEDLWVDPPFQRRGIGSQLLRAQLLAISGDGYATASLECLEANVHARRFYEREGWRPVYRYSRSSHLFNRDIPRIRFEWDLWRR